MTRMHLRRMRPVVLALALGASAAHAADGKLLLTGGVASIDGAAGGGLTPWAVTGSYATRGQVGQHRGQVDLDHRAGGKCDLCAARFERLAAIGVG